MLGFFREKFKDYQTARFDAQEFLGRYYLDDQGNAVIRMQLSSLSDAYSPFSAPGYEELSGEFADYLDGVIYHIPLQHPIRLHLQVPCAPASQQQQPHNPVTNSLYVPS